MEKRSILLIAAFPFRRRAPEAAGSTVCGTPKMGHKKSLCPQSTAAGRDFFNRFFGRKGVFSSPDDEALTVHLRRAGQTHHIQNGGGDIRQTAGSAAPCSAPQRIKGTGLVVVGGSWDLPSGWRITSAMPWSAVIMSDAAHLQGGVHHPAHAGVHGLHGLARPRRSTPVWPTMSQLAKFRMMTS